MRLELVCVCALAAHAALPLAARAEEADFDARIQSTYVWQSKAAMRSPYEGPHSLGAPREKSYTFSATGFLGWRLAPSTEVYLDPEAVQGVPLSRLQGLGGMSNGEAQKSAGPNITAYRARAFLQHTWGLGGEREAVEADANQLAGSRDRNRIVLTVGNFAVTDLFDRSAWSGDPRTQFLNWSFLTHAAFDYPADARGYTNGIVAALFRGDWQLRAGRFLLPKEPNGTALDWRAGRHFGDVIEAVHTHRIGEREGNVRVLAFRDRAVMSGFEDALEQARTAGGAPSLDAVRGAVKSKSGWGIAFDQEVARGVGVFGRAFRSDGRTEVYAFAEVDRSASAGISARGDAWGRADDKFGLAVASNALSAPHRAYLAAGGMGFFVGDARLSYAPERILEAFYSAALHRHLALAIDWQVIRNPAYNADRGPARIFSARLHAEF